MQTLKTAIVVVLLLTVTYSAYVALTAPTPELPAEVASLVEGDSLDLGEIGMGEIDSGTPVDFAADFDSGMASSGDSAAPGQDPSAGPSGIGFPFAAGGAASARLSDQPGSVAAGPRSKPAASASPSDSASSRGSNPDLAATAPQSLPKPDPSTGSVSADPNQNYPSTAFGDFDLSLAGGSPESASPAPSIAASGSSTLEASEEADAGDDASAARDAAGTGNASGSPHPGLVNAIATADRQWENDQLREALTTLSLFYNDPDLQASDREPLQARLDMLAGEVIYSTRHLLEQPYRVREGDTLQSIAETYEVPWQLLANINQVQDPAAIVPGQELKIMRGPFRAEVSLDRSELTLFLGELYAGRFPIGLGNDPLPEPGTYTVKDKQTARTYYPLTGGNIPAGDPRNPYGQMWLDLGGQLCIHGSPETGSGEPQGCIQLRTADARDVYGILSKGSAVSIIR
ncbi:LysM peptidoglycan-binding domain-containing protein [Candidatus Laterigemmans baculatus]|uniref:LysM peptidoglycan-binding domain-containing protein n=1 Tax=Candidatus Laterigemmans baculatus TaxID=2770505 RepID=UPI0013DD5667|nr:LysM peptidoglycan-binding domain-containing protein [Candidatus Laterigemmans baculatus]